MSASRPLAVVALGGNALLRRGQAPRAALQRANIEACVAALAPLAVSHDLVLSHGNGPQVGLLAQQQAALGTADFPLDVLDAETAGMIGYLLQQALGPRLPAGRPCAALVTQVEVAADDAAFGRPDKPIGPLYPDAAAARAAHPSGAVIVADGAGFRRAVPSPAPRGIVELPVIEHLLRAGVVTICAGGGGVPVVRAADGSLRGVEAVVDKDRASAWLASALGADTLLLLTDVDAVYTDFDGPRCQALRRAQPVDLARWQFAAGSMGPKVEAAAAFVAAGGRRAVIGALEDCLALIDGRAGTTIEAGAALAWWERADAPGSRPESAPQAFINQ